MRLRVGGGVALGTVPQAGRPGGGLDFVGHQAYRLGDDVRHVDWSLYGRNGELYVRQFEDEARGQLVLLVDASGSMSIGSPSKWDVARRLATIISVAALRGLQPVSIGVLSDGDWAWLPPGHGEEYAWKLSDFMRQIAPSGRGGFGPALTRLMRDRARGQLLVFSDFIDETAHVDGFAGWSQLNGVPIMCRIEAREEFDLPDGGQRVADPEGLGSALLPSDFGELKAIEQTLKAHRRPIRRVIARCRYSGV